MQFNNYATAVKQEFYIRIIKLLRENDLVEGIRRIPVEMRPMDGDSSRCCVHKDRYMIRHKLISIMGMDLEPEDDIDLINGSDLAQKALDEKNPKKDILSVIHEACSACIQSQHQVTNLCRGCVGRPCTMSCPKKAISMLNSRAHIDQDSCVNCGMCVNACPYNAIVYTPVPCEEACPVKAITKDEKGVEHIDKDKCIYCGKCMKACPYGAIMERTKIIDIYKSLTNPNVKTIAMPAPAVYAQYGVHPSKILNAIKKLGFDDVIEVALGADDTTAHETEEYLERLHEGKNVMTTSCCPAYVGWVDKHAPEIKHLVSDTPSPMIYTGKRAHEKYPNEKIEVVFIGPCLAKRYEAEVKGGIDYVMSFEELNAYFEAFDIKVDDGEETALTQEISPYGRDFARAGGVRDSVIAKLGGKEINTVYYEGLSKKNQGALKMLPKNNDQLFVEVMVCDGGCINGPGCIAALPNAKRQLKKVIDNNGNI